MSAYLGWWDHIMNENVKYWVTSTIFGFFVNVKGIEIKMYYALLLKKTIYE